MGPSILVVGFTIAALMCLLSQDATRVPAPAERGRHLRLAMLLDLVPLFVADAALEATGASGPWAAILSARIGPNLLIVGAGRR